MRGDALGRAHRKGSPSYSTPPPSTLQRKNAAKTTEEKHAKSKSQYHDSKKHYCTEPGCKNKSIMDLSTLKMHLLGHAGYSCEVQRQAAHEAAAEKQAAASSVMWHGRA